MFGCTPEWRTLHADSSTCETLSPEKSYIHLSEVLSALQGWRYQHFSRSTGLPESPEERQESARVARLEEQHAQVAVPEVWNTVPDPRPAATSTGDYFELNPELVEALEIDYPGLSTRKAPTL